MNLKQKHLRHFTCEKLTSSWNSFKITQKNPKKKNEMASSPQASPPKKIPALLLKNSWLAHLHDTAAANEAGGVTILPESKRAAKLLLWKGKKHTVSVFVAFNCKPVLVCVGFKFQWFYYSINLTHFLKGWNMDPFGSAFQEWNEHLGDILVWTSWEKNRTRSRSTWRVPQIWESIDQLESDCGIGQHSSKSFLAEIRNISENSSLSLFDVMRTEDCKDLPSFAKYQLSVSWLGYHHSEKERGIH